MVYLYIQLRTCLECGLVGWLVKARIGPARSGGLKLCGKHLLRGSIDLFC